MARRRISVERLYSLRDDRKSREILQKLIRPRRFWHEGWPEESLYRPRPKRKGWRF